MKLLFRATYYVSKMNETKIKTNIYEATSEEELRDYLKTEKKISGRIYISQVSPIVVPVKEEV